MRFRDLSLGSKLTVTIVAITVAVLGSAFALVATTQVRTFHHDSREKAQLITRVVANYSVPTLAFVDRPAALETLARLADVPEARYARLYDATGRSFATWGSGGGAEQVDPMLPAGVGKDGGLLRVVAPVVDGDARFGTLVVALSTEELHARITAYLITLAIALVLLVVATWALAHRIGRRIVRPTVELTAVARRVSREHDYTLRALRGGHDEIGELCESFNHMLDEIHARELERDKADRRTREKSQFLANMSHELRTPMNSVIGFSEILLTRLQGRVEPKEIRFVENIHSSGLHLLGVINDILDLSKVEAGKMTLSLEEVAAPAIGKAVAQIMNGIAGKRAIAITVTAEEPQPPLEVDVVKLKQILYNLLSNAVKFSPQGATVGLEIQHLSTAASPLGEASTMIAVSDQGPGIDASDHERIFEEFKQIDGQSSSVEGTGLGLALVKRFVELHRGRVIVESALGRGTRLVLHLPQQQRPASAAAVAPKSRVLIIEADAAAYEAIRRQLDDTRYAPVWARSLEQGHELARRNRPAAIALDITAPGLDGWEALRALRADPATREVPILVVPLDGSRLGPALDAADFWLLSRLDEAQLAERLRGVFQARARADQARRILLIDDDPMVHELIESWLRAPLYHVEHARSGAEGLDRARARPPEVILLDLLMDGMDGFEVALRLQRDARTGRVPIVLLSAKDLDAGDRKRLRGRIVATVQKGPGAEARLSAVIDELLRAHPPRPGRTTGAQVTP